MKHVEFMARALELARYGAGHTSPNPMVGAVIVKHNRIIGEGYHPRFGQKHAEVMAIEQAHEAVEGAEMYCNLEPCSHTIPGKKTPPCTERLVREKIRKLYLSTLDPNPYVNGNGVAAIRAAGIEVETGLLAQEALELNEAYFKFIQTRLPFVNLKMALTLDGRIAAAGGDSRWISDEAARERVHRLRHEYDAVLIGANTLRIDNPRLTVRPLDQPIPAARQPWRIILAGNGDLPLHSEVFRDQFREKTLVFTAARNDNHRPAVPGNADVRVIPLKSNAGGRPDILAALKYSGEMGISSVLVEGGSRIFTEFISRGLFDKITAFIAPLILGRGIEAVGDLGIERMSGAIRLQRSEIETINDQVLLRGYRNIKETFGSLTESVACLQESSKSWAELALSNR
ncbi:MAG: bifunctional diaminohydroxyphosphoribosylaminopyrimidine deaminase/5-amino-6-(5-phosphoribosylamino)uracil reductase RibD [Calditrichaceae bacterium]|nr:bifunctional diaminohydroxyphosphoribosylaminopyrimidine deaminase/5-amino-6-(5-phosphoribosylamino)uracil reductase RibD [Calditrichia bacterium]NUQ43780.1 bifunctional diaminohydroxyphosphoribosylaminopyrimidine deaminase/5-amino-6-(5-phosphoribosylamino)uracil reductase RibD [Calditrichaceae bacterium]